MPRRKPNPVVVLQAVGEVDDHLDAFDIDPAEPASTTVEPSDTSDIITATDVTYYRYLQESLRQLLAWAADQHIARGRKLSELQTKMRTRVTEYLIELAAVGEMLDEQHAGVSHGVRMQLGSMRSPISLSWTEEIPSMETETSWLRALRKIHLAIQCDVQTRYVLPTDAQRNTVH